MSATTAKATFSPSRLDSIFKHYEPLLKRCKSNIIAGLSGAPCEDMLTNHFQRGKMLRPLLVFAAASSVGGDPTSVIMAAEAVELLHGASLVHDDIIDDAAERRGLPALHTRVGAGAALVLGDYLLMHAFATLGKSQTIHEPGKVLEALNVLNRYAQKCCRGQIEELLPDDSLDPEATYFSIVQGKTASQFAAAATLGAILGGGSQSEVDLFHHYGMNVGIAFQIHDDVLDLVGESWSLGKPVGQFLTQEWPILPLIYLEKYGCPVARRQYHQMREGNLDLPQLVALLKEEQIINRIRVTQKQYITAAVQALVGLRPSDAVADLRSFPLHAVAWQE